MTSFNRRKSKNKLGFSRLGRANKLAAQNLRADGGLPDPAALRGPVVRRRGIYLLPNAFTTAALFCGFYAIVMAMNLKFDHSAIAIFAAMVLDATDGRVARLTNTQSEF